MLNSGRKCIDYQCFIQKAAKSQQVNNYSFNIIHYKSPLT